MDEITVSPCFGAAIRSAVFDSSSKFSADQLKSWSLLPVLCCEGAGGTPQLAIPVAVTWYLIYAAAHLADAIEDNDPPDSWWQDLGRGTAFNLATAIYLSAWRALDKLYDRPEAASAAREIHQAFVHQLTIMVEGQHRDLTVSEPDSREWLEIAGAKSGAFFQVATWAGARLAIDDRARLKRFGDFGYALGTLLQILDDIQDLYSPPEESNCVEEKFRKWRLPLAYAMEVAPPEKQSQIRAVLSGDFVGSGARASLTELLDELGASLYIGTLIEQWHRKALAALQEAAPPSPARDALANLLSQLRGGVTPAD